MSDGSTDDLKPGVVSRGEILMRHDLHAPAIAHSCHFFPISLTSFVGDARGVPKTRGVNLHASAQPRSRLSGHHCHHRAVGRRGWPEDVAVPVYMCSSL